jgi:hypothetical protein
VLTLRAAAGLLRAASTPDDLLPIASALGFESSPTRLDDEALAAFGLDSAFGDVRLLRGPGSLRAITFASDSDDSRAKVIRAASRLVARSPLGLWVIMAVEPDACRVTIAAASPGQRGVRVAALIVDRARVVDSDAETLRQLAAARTADDIATHARFVEILGRDALTRRFFRRLDECIGTLADSGRVGSRSARREIALLYGSRLLFLGFLESKGWLNDDPAFLANAFDTSMQRGGDFHSRVLLPLFFGTLNTPSSRRAARARSFGKVPFLNGGLFTPTAVERELRPLRFSDEACGRFIGELLSRYRFTAREDTSSFEEVAVDPEMLGRAFESLMAAESRRTSGAYYTPHELVERATALAFTERLGATPALEALRRIRILDPACGSGAFLVHALDRLAHLRADAGDGRAMETIRRDVLASSIFGVDVNPTAVWLCQLRLWLSIVVESRADGDDIPPLPNLDRQVRAGDSLSGVAFDQVMISGGPALRRLRARYTRATGPRKAAFARELDRAERKLVIAAANSELTLVTGRRRDLLSVQRGRDLFGGRRSPSPEERDQALALRVASLALRRRIRALKTGAALPFSFPAHFADVAAEGGFSIIVGNPPWVRPHHVDSRTRETLRHTFSVARSAPWMPGAAAAGAGRGFSSQVDLAAIFVERSLRLLAGDGVLSLLLPSKLWKSLSAGGLRRLVTTEARVVAVEDYSDVPSSFDAAVYPGLLIATRDRSLGGEVGVSVLHRSRTATHWRAPLTSLAFDGSPGAPWLLIPPEVRRSFERLREAGPPLSESSFGRPLLGVKCGFNEAFIVSAVDHHERSARIRAENGREADIEPALLRPVLRGEDVHPWSHARTADRIVWTHGVDGNPLARLPDSAARWLAPYRRALIARSDARRASRWWAVFRTDAASADKPRVVWADIGRSVRATVLPAGDCTVPLNTCYVARCRSDDDALALCALLNSALASAWLSVVAEQARGGYRRYLGWTMALLPIPRRWDECKRSLAAASGSEPDQLLDIAIGAYGLRRTDVEPLLTWAAE